MDEMKYEIKHDGLGYSVLYGKGYPSSKFIKYQCWTLRGAKRAIRKHKRKIALGKIDPVSNPYDIIYTEKRLTEQDVEAHIKQLERELGIG